MRRLLMLLGLLMALPAHAAVQVIFPAYATGEAQRLVPGAQTLVCGRFVQPTHALGLTRVAVNVTTGFGVGKVVGWALYPDLDAGTALFSVGNQPAAVAAPVVATVTAFDVTGGVTYRDCICATGTAGAYAAPHWLPDGISVAALQNSFVASVGTAANPCDVNGNPPATTGAITPDDTLAPPFVVAE